ncbi:hypothetical protein QUC31_018300 [Theobroma cacao]|uniref:DUF7731 domain-containing protein n=2 Tax=Theobroma cacao TaxID=3641 RepID=A0A061GY12_THECC|nr:PREDICTED: uncharacterized protein LOC18591100 [Theobroma cacao]EOY34715.1 Uncharacterized protein TCM_042299 [Theobroma cacao]
MEYRRSLWLLTGILLLLRHAAAQNKTDIPKHVNLSPIWGWISAAECLLKYQQTSGCKGKQVLTLTGVINVDVSEFNDYCKTNGCRGRTEDVLDCIHSVKRDFRFTNKAGVMFVRNAITEGCTNLADIDTTVYPSSSATKLYSSSRILFLSMVAFMILLASMNISDHA